MSENLPIVIAALYHFAAFPDFKARREDVLERAKTLGIRGTLLLAHEGMNGTIAGYREAIDAILVYLRSIPGFESLEHKESFASEQPFLRLKVRLKKEIVTSGVPELADPTKAVGEYVDAEAWNALISNPDTIVIDTRNDYEVALGTFERALNPQTQTFRDFPEFVSQMEVDKDKPVAMFCTGGIRCEKASSYMKSQGFSKVYHLKGGILKYLEIIPKEHSKWQGECFVFDHRVTVDHDLYAGHYELCHGCRNPITGQDKASPWFEEGVSCPQCYHMRSETQKQSARERHKQMQLAKQRHHAHLGAVLE